MLEGDVEAVLAQRVRELGGLSYKFAPLHAGNPDRLVLLPGGRILLVEVKANDGELHAAQRLWHARAAALGITVHIVRGAEEARNFLSEPLAEPGTSA